MNVLLETNWDLELMDHLSEVPQVKEILAVTPNKQPVHDSPHFIIDNVQKKTTLEYIQKVHAAGRKFNYLLNGSCLDGMKYHKHVHYEILPHIRWLMEIGVDSLTVTIPYFLEIIKTHFPGLEVRVSSIAHVNSVQRAKFFEKLGADAITLDFNINRDFKLLKQIRKAVNCRLSLVVNDGCLYQCPYRYYHYNTLGQTTQSIPSIQSTHSTHTAHTAQLTQPDHPPDISYIDYCILRCTIEKFSNPKEIIKSRWIRPEDIHHYEEIGIDSFKITGRQMTTPWLLNVITAYTGQRYDGNLFDILNCAAPGIDPEFYSHRYLTFLEKNQFLEGENIDHWDQLYPLKPYIDNRALNGFIHYFRNQDCLSECDRCNYCEDLAAKAVDIESMDPVKYTGTLKEVLREFMAGRITVDLEQDCLSKEKNKCTPGCDILEQHFSMINK